MTVPHYVFVDDNTGENSDGERFRTLLNKAGQLSVSLVRPDRAALLVTESELKDAVDGFILDINLKDQADENGLRFLGTGAGLAQDLRLLQALGARDGQRARPIIRLCAAQVFQAYLAGDNSTADIFDLGFDKETIGDCAEAARAKLAALPDLYNKIISSNGSADAAPALLGLDGQSYGKLHSRFRAALETELTRKPHEAASFLIRQFLEVPGLLVSEDVLAVRLGVDCRASSGWAEVLKIFEGARYNGVGSSGFSRWWAEAILQVWAERGLGSLFKLTAESRVHGLASIGIDDLVPLQETADSPGDRPWLISTSDDPELRRPADPRFVFPLSAPVSPWLDEPAWCLEQARRDRNAPQLSEDTKERLKATLTRLRKDRE